MMSPEMLKVAQIVYDSPRTRVALLSVSGLWLLKVMAWRWWKKWCLAKKLASRRLLAEQRKKLVRQRCEQVVDSRAIFASPAKNILEDLKQGKITALEVLHSFQKEALQLTDRINCVTEPIVEAEEWAKALDASQHKHGLLHGFPISLKENITLAGYDATAGLECFIGNIYKEDSVIVKVLKQHGAIPFVRTNLPQTMMSYCCSNPIYGETVNPKNELRCPGGSSGGEGAILGGGGSVMGIGSDVGGSIRVPSDFCGAFGLKTTCYRISTKGIVTFGRGNLAIQGVIGPMARDFSSLVTLSRAVMSPEMYALDPSLPYLPFNEKEFQKTGPLRIGFYTYDGFCKCHPPVVRAVMEAKQGLEKMGHELVPFDFPSLMGDGFPSGEFYIRMMVADRSERFKKLLANDQVDKVLRAPIFGSKFPRWIICLLRYAIKPFDKTAAAALCAALGFPSVFKYMEHVILFKNWKEHFMQVWTDLQLDAVICPVFPSPAVTRRIIPSVTPLGSYCQMYNTLDFPSGVMPVTKVTQEDIQKSLDPSVFTPETNMEKVLLKSMKDAENMSVGVQCVALPFKEEMCLRVMRDLQNSLTK